MLRVIATQLMIDIADAFDFTETIGSTLIPRDVIYYPDADAMHRRQSRMSKLGYSPEQNMPFISFYRLGARVTPHRMNYTAAVHGAKYTASVGSVTKYKIIPTDMMFQIEHWSDNPVDAETAIENYLIWSAPPSELVVTDTNGVEFAFPMNFDDPQDNSLREPQREVGRIYRITFPVLVMGFVVVGGSPIKTILTEYLNIYDNTIDDVDNAPLLDSFTQT